MLSNDVSVRGRSFRVSSDQKYLSFWEKFNEGAWEAETLDLIDAYVDEATVFIDVGAWIGPTLLYAAQKCRSAFAFEPDPRAFAELRINVNLNKRDLCARSISIFEKAVSSDGSAIAMGSLSDEGGDSTSSIALRNEDNNWEVESVIIEEFLENYDIFENDLFVKVDIEGAEYCVCKSFYQLSKRANSLVLFLSIHNYHSSHLNAPNSFWLSPMRAITKRMQAVRLFYALRRYNVFHLQGERLGTVKTYSRIIWYGGLPGDLVCFFGNFNHEGGVLRNSEARQTRVWAVED